MFCYSFRDMSSSPDEVCLYLLSCHSGCYIKNGGVTLTTLTRHWLQKLLTYRNHWSMTMLDVWATLLECTFVSFFLLFLLKMISDDTFVETEGKVYICNNSSDIRSDTLDLHWCNESNLATCTLQHKQSMVKLCLFQWNQNFTLGVE